MFVNSVWPNTDRESLRALPFSASELSAAEDQGVQLQKLRRKSISCFLCLLICSFFTCGQYGEGRVLT